MTDADSRRHQAALTDSEASVPPDFSTVAQLLHRAAEHFGDHEALVGVDDGCRLTFRQLNARVDEVARGLLALGVGPGERIAIFMPNGIEWILTYLAGASIGAIVVPINTGFSVREVGYVVSQSGSSLLVTTSRPGRRDYVADARAALESEQLRVTSTVVVGDGADVPRVDGWLSFDELLAQGAELDLASVRDRQRGVASGDTFIMLYTSGTTGFPKGAMHNHSLIANMKDAAAFMDQRCGDRLVLYMPLFHVFGAAAILTFLHIGGTVIVMTAFDAEKSLRVMSAERATIVYGINTMYFDQVNLSDFDSFDLSSVRLCLAPGTADLVRIAEKIGPAINGYGMTECSSITTLARLEDPFELRGETIGRPLPGFELKIVDPRTGQEVEQGEPGELVVRGFPVMIGYYNRPEETAAVLDAEGWFRTGDIASLTTEGYVRFVGREKEMVRVAGENVDLVEVDTVLMRHPAVALAAACGMADERRGEVVVACVQLKSGQGHVEAEELIKHARASLAGFKTPRRILVVDELPKTGSGKIKRFELPALFS